MAKIVSRAAPEMLVPWAMTADPGADADWASGAHSPARKYPTSGNLPSTLIDPGMDVNQVGGSMMAVSCAGNAPTIGLFAPPSLFHWTMPLRPLPLRLAAVRPVTSPAEVRKLAPFRSAPMYPPPAAKNAWSRVRAVAPEGQPAVLKTRS